MTSCHEEVIRTLIQLYKKGAMNQDFRTGQAAPARFIHTKGILLQKSDKTCVPLRLNSIITLINTVWKEMKQEESQAKKQSNGTGQSFY